MRITFYSKQLTSISICDNINKLESGLFASPTTCIYFILGRICMAELLGFITKEEREFILSKISRLIGDAEIL